MQRFQRRNIAALVLAAMVATAAPSANANEYKAGPLVIDRPWVRATPGGAKIAGGYMTISNTGTTSDRLVGGSFVRATRFEVHEMRMQGSVMQMRELPNGLEIGPKQTIKLAPGGYHLMLMGLKQPLKQGERVKGELVFEKAGTVEIEYVVEAIGAGSGHGGH